MFSCNYQRLEGVLRELVCHPFFEDHKCGRGSRPAACSAWLSTMPQKWSHILIHPSRSSSVPRSRPPSLMKAQRGRTRRQQSDQTPPSISATHQFVRLSLFMLQLVHICFQGTSSSTEAGSQTRANTYILRACVHTRPAENPTKHQFIAH